MVLAVIVVQLVALATVETPTNVSLVPAQPSTSTDNASLPVHRAQPQIAAEHVSHVQAIAQLATRPHATNATQVTSLFREQANA